MNSTPVMKIQVGNDTRGSAFLCPLFTETINFLEGCFEIIIFMWSNLYLKGVFLRLRRNGMY